MIDAFLALGVNEISYQVGDSESRESLRRIARVHLNLLYQHRISKEEAAPTVDVDDKD